MDQGTLTWGLIALAVLVVGGGLWWRSRHGRPWHRSEQDTAHQPHPQETKLAEDDLATLLAEAAQAEEDTRRRRVLEAQIEADAARAAAVQAQQAADAAQQEQDAEAAAREAERATAEATAREARRAAKADVAAAAALAQRQAAEAAEADAAARRRAVEAAAQDAENAARQAAEREAQRIAVEAATTAEAQRQAALLQRTASEAAAAAAEQHGAALEAVGGAPSPGLAGALRRPEETLVMIADDSKVVRVKTSRLLVQRGYRVVLAEDGAQAAALLEAELPAVLITDVEMPGMDGFALTRHVRAHPRAHAIPIIMITSADDRLKGAAAEAGVTLVLGKPYPEDELIACIERSQSTALA